MIKTENIGLPFLLGNKLFKHSFPVYRILYKLYKACSDRSERAILKEIIKPGMTVLDIGANIGIYTSFMAKIVGEKGRVYAFEPSPHNFNLLKKYNNQGNVTLVQTAIGDTTGRIALYISDKLNVDHRTYETGEKRKKIDVPSYRLDDYLQGRKIDFVKMDIQGFEYKALLGMENTLQNNQDIQILMEFWPYGLIKAGSKPEEVLAFLHRLGFQTELIEGNQRKRYPPIPKQTDFAYYRSLFVFR
jgi:FkbM family methyltransferase